MRRLIPLLLFFILFSGLVDAAVLEIQEEGSVLDYYGMYYVVDVEGELTITNDNDFPINTVQLHLTSGSLTFSGMDGTSYVSHDKVQIPYIPEGESRSLRYRISGVTNKNVVRYYESDGESVLRHLMDEDNLRYRSDLWINLEKSEISEAQGMRRRILGVTITNPHPLEYDIKSIKVHRTDDMDVNDPDKLWTFDDKVKIHGGDTWSRNFRDESDSMREDSIYWFIVDHDLARVLAEIYEDNDIDVYDEDELDEVPSVDPDEPDLDEIDKEFRERTLVFLRKLIEPSVVYPGDVIDVSVIVTNLDAMPKSINVRDTVPQGFELVNVSHPDLLRSPEGSEDLEWRLEVNRDTSRILEYSIRFIDEESLGLNFLPAAEATFAEGTVSSSRPSYIMRFIPQKQLYLQKQIIRLPGDRAEVTITLRNIGEAALDNLVLKEFIEEDASFSDITENYNERGIWELPVLDTDEVWEVSYKTDYRRGIARLPQVMGIEESKVLKTMLMSSHLTHSIVSPSVSIMEVLGIALLIVFPFVFIRTYKRKLLEKRFS